MRSRGMGIAPKWTGSPFLGWGRRLVIRLPKFKHVRFGLATYYQKHKRETRKQASRRVVQGTGGTDLFRQSLW